jgi:cyclophilin family peptidyl-prolyl cis-trans isomerase
MKRNLLLIAYTGLVIVIAACGGEEQATPTATARPAAQPTAAPLARMLQKGDKPQPPQGVIDRSKTYYATFKTEVGEFRVELLDDKAPLTVENFVNLARIGYYDNTTFHRVLKDFMAQGGDPTGTGGGGPGYRFKDEFDSSLTFSKPGILAMANAGPNTNGSQFFVTFVPTPHLNNAHTIFGQVIEGMEVVQKIKLRDPSNPAESSSPGQKLLTVEIEEK